MTTHTTTDPTVVDLTVTDVTVTDVTVTDPAVTQAEVGAGSGAARGETFSDWYDARLTTSGGVEIWDRVDRTPRPATGEADDQRAPRVVLDAAHATDVADYLHWHQRMDIRPAGLPSLVFEAPTSDAGEAFHLDPAETPGLLAFLTTTHDERTARAREHQSEHQDETSDVESGRAEDWTDAW